MANILRTFGIYLEFLWNVLWFIIFYVMLYNNTNIFSDCPRCTIDLYENKSLHSYNEYYTTIHETCQA